MRFCQCSIKQRNFEKVSLDRSIEEKYDLFDLEERLLQAAVVLRSNVERPSLHDSVSVAAR